MKKTDYGLVSCQFERDMIARADKAIKQDKRRAKQHGAFNMQSKGGTNYEFTEKNNRGRKTL